MEKKLINPWSWQDGQGWSWGIEASGASRVLFCAGQVATDASGHVTATDMPGQIRGALDNLETVLQAAGYELGDVMRIDYYAVDVPAVMEHWDIVKQRLVSAGCRAGGVLLGVTALAVPALLIEIQAIAAK
jgi:enamine deaminase RidA (YjgF/YER057c/UK114 family)